METKLYFRVRISSQQDARHWCPGCFCVPLTKYSNLFPVVLNRQRHRRTLRVHKSRNISFLPFEKRSSFWFSRGTVN